MVNDVKCLKQHFITYNKKNCDLFIQILLQIEKVHTNKRQDSLACKTDKQNNACDIELDIMNFQKLNVILSFFLTFRYFKFILL